MEKQTTTSVAETAIKVGTIVASLPDIDPQVDTIQFGISDNALEVFKKRYALEKENGELESPEDMCRRVAHTLASVEKLVYKKTPEQVRHIEDVFYEVIVKKEFTPAGRTLANAGGPTRLVSNCIVLNVQDSMDSIFETLKDAALLQQAGSGLGFPFHLMRPAGFSTRKSKGQASGPVSFLKVYNQAFGVIKQQNRHGANMAVMRVDHPDILEFIHCKEVEGDVKNFNISVGLTDAFMDAVRSNDLTPWMCEWGGKKMKPRHIKRDGGETMLNIEEVDMTARELFEEIIEAAWTNGEPGCVFLDEVNRTNPVPGLGRIEACNPCGEQFLHDGDVCNLGSINLEKFVTDDKKINVKRLREVTRVASRMLDNVIDLSDFPVEKVNSTFRSNRRIGLGIMGFADMLLRLGIAYDSEEGRQAAELVMSTIQDEAHATSRELAEEKGVFPNWDKSIYKQQGVKMRNAAMTNIAPTGTIAMLFDVSGGVEPYFALAYHYKGILGGKTELQYINKYLKQALEDAGVYSEDLMERIIEEGSLQNIDGIPESVKRTFVVAMDIASDAHTRMQAAFQKHLDNSISKTINFPNSATREEVLQGYILAWELKCKGCTVYRDGSRQFQVLNLNGKKKKKEESTPVAAADAPATDTIETPSAEQMPAPTTSEVTGALATIAPRERPSITNGSTYRVRTGYGNIYITINNDDSGQPFEVFATMGKSGGFFAAKSEAICRLASLALRSGIPAEEIAQQLKGIRGPSPVWSEGGQILSLPDAIGQIIERHIKRSQPQLNLDFSATAEASTPPTAAEAVIQAAESQATPKTSIADLGDAPVCPDCHSMLEITEGCIMCRSCGYTKCS